MRWPAELNNYSGRFKMVIVYLFSLTLSYYIYSFLAKTGLIYNFPIHNDLGYNTIMHRYAMLVVFIFSAVIGFILYRANMIFLQHGLSVAMILILGCKMYSNSWFEYENVPASVLFCLVFAYYTVSFIERLKYIKIGFKIKNVNIIIAAAAAIFLAVYSVYFIRLALMRHHAFLTSAFDLGWENQALYNLTFTGVPYSSFINTNNNFGDHTSFIYYLISVFYRFYPHPEFLLILQVLVVVFAAAALYMLAARILKKPLFAAAIALVFLLHPAVQGLMLEDFHTNTLAIPLLFLSLYFAEKGESGKFSIPFFLMFAVREDAAFLGLILILYLLAAKKIRLRPGMFFLAAALALNAAVYLILRKFGPGLIDMNRFYFLFPNFAGIIFLPFINPFFTVSGLMDPGKINYLLIFSAPLLFLFYFNAENWIILFYGLLFTVFTKCIPHFTIGYHYGFAMICAGFAGTIAVIKNLNGKDGKFLTAGRAAGLMLMAAIFFNFLYGNFFSKSLKLTWIEPPVLEIKGTDYYYNGGVGCFKQLPREIDNEALDYLRRLPDKYSVSADFRLSPHVSGRKLLFTLPAVNNADFIVMLKESGLKIDEGELKDYSPIKETSLIRVLVKKSIAGRL